MTYIFQNIFSFLQNGCKVTHYFSHTQAIDKKKCSFSDANVFENHDVLSNFILIGPMYLLEQKSLENEKIIFLKKDLHI